MNVLFYFVLSVFFVFGSEGLLSQTLNPEAYRLKKEIEQSKGEQKVDLIIEFLTRYNKAYNPIAIQLSEEALSMTIAPEKKGELLFYVGQTYRIYGDLSHAFELLNETLEISTQRKDSTLFVLTSSEIGKANTVLGNYEEAREHLYSSLRIAELIDYNNAVIINKNRIAVTYQRQGNYKKSLEIYDSFMDNCEDYSTINNCYGFRIQEAVSYNRTGNPSRAFEIFFSARAYYVEKGDVLRKSILDHHLGFLLKQNGFYSEALPFFIDTESYFLENYNKEQIIHIKVNIGSLLSELGEYDQAETYFLDANILSDESFNDVKPDVFYELGALYKKKLEFGKADEFLTAAYELNYQQNDELGLLETLVERAELALMQNDRGKTETLLNTAIPIAEKLDLKKELSKAYSIQMKLFEQMNALESYRVAQTNVIALEEEILSENEELEIKRALILEALNHNGLNKNQPSGDDAEPDTVAKIPFYSVGFALLGLLLIFSFQWMNNTTLKKKPVPAVNRIKEKDVDVLKQNLETVIRTHQYYLNPDLSLSELAEQIGLTDKKLSYLLNKHLKTNFYDFINEYRVQCFIEKLKTGRYSNYSISGLALDCGFKSKSSFYRVFKKHTGTSPKEFKAQL